ATQAEVSTVVSGEPTPAAAAQTKAVEAGSGSKKKRSPWVWIGVVLVVLLGAIVLIFARSSGLIPNFLLKPGEVNITASSTLQDSSPSAVLDGNDETIWSSGAKPTQWIQLEYGTPITVVEIRLTVSQPFGGDTIHQIWGGETISGM